MIYPGLYDIREFDAQGNGTMLNIRAIQQAVDTCSQDGGGTVRIAQGCYLSGTLFLKNRVTLEVTAGATLLASPNIADYPEGTGKNLYKNEPHMDRCFIYAEGVQHIGICGQGTIDGNGGRENFPNAGDPHGYRPMLIRFKECRTIRIRDITLRRPAAWTSAWLYCDDIVVDGITIHSRVNENGDGLDFDGCTDVRVSNCSFDTSDDSICLQSSRTDRPCRNVTITNCNFCSKWAGMRIGLLSLGNFENVCVSNCTFRDHDDSGLKIQMCEGAVMQNMVFNNLMMQNVPRPIFMTLCRQRACVDAPEELKPLGKIQNMRFSDMVIDNRELGAESQLVLTGLPEGKIEGMFLDNIAMTTKGGGAIEDADASTVREMTPENLEGWWPEYEIFETIAPAYGLYARHIHGLNCSNLSFRTLHPDRRPAIVCDDVSNADFQQIACNPDGDTIIYIERR